MTTQKQIIKAAYSSTSIIKQSGLAALLLSLLITSFSGGNALASEISITPIASPSDDAEEAMSTGRVNLASSDIELTYEKRGVGGQRVGLRFALNIPRDSVITNAYIQFTTDEVSTGHSYLIINTENSANAAPFSGNDFDISSRSATAASLVWTPPHWNTIGQRGIDQRTPNLSSMIQEIIDSENWQANNHVAFVIYGSGTRTSVSHDGSLLNYGSTEFAPQLHVEFTSANASEPALAPESVPVDNIPVAQQDSLTTSEETAATVNVLDNDTGLEDGGISIAISSPPSNGSVTIGQSGNLTYTPNSGYTGTDVFTYHINDADGDTSSASVNVTIKAINAIVHGPVVISDDAEEAMSTGRVDLTSNHLVLTYERGGVGGQRVGLRFALNAPSDSVITNAYIQFTSDKVSTSDSYLVINAENSANAAPFSGNDFDISSRRTTASSVTWTPPSWNAVGQNGMDQRTPNLSAMIQEIIDSENWQANNHIAFILYGGGARTSVSRNGALLNYGSTEFAPQLHVEFTSANASEPAPFPVPVDNIPAAQQDSLTTSEETAATINVLDNDSGLEDGGITVTISSRTVPSPTPPTAAMRGVTPSPIA